MAPLLKSVERMEVTREIMWVLVGMSVLFGSSCEKKLPVVNYLMNMAPGLDVITKAKTWLHSGRMRGTSDD